MLQLLKKVFGGNSNEREVKKLGPLVEEINRHAEALQALSDDDLREKTDGFKAQIREAVAPVEEEQADVRARLRSGDDAPDVGGHPGGDGATSGPAASGLSVRERQDLYARLDDLEREWLDAAEDVLDDVLPEAFAVVKETCRRLVGRTYTAGGSEVQWDMVPYDVQLVGGVALHRGSVAEMKTGEGKTLVAVAPIYLNALVGRGVHIVTVNPYLSTRDSEWMAPVLEFHGLSVGCIDRHEAHSPGRRAAYRADVTYGTNNEFGFDYLRDNSFVIDPEQLVQRGHHYAIVDEVDSVLIDEARTPLIISGPVPQGDEDRYQELQSPVERLVRDQQRLVAEFAGAAERHMACQRCRTTVSVGDDRGRRSAGSSGRWAATRSRWARTVAVRSARSSPSTARLIRGRRGRPPGRRG